MKSQVVLLAVACSMLCCTPLQAQLQWEEVTLPEGCTDFRMFPRDSLFCVVIQGEHAWKTLDGGATWMTALRLGSGVKTVADIHPDGIGIWFANSGIYLSSDFGARWIRSKEDFPSTFREDLLTDIAILSPTRSMVVYDGQLYETQTNFATLSPVTTPLSVVTEVEFADSLSGCITSSEGIAWTADGGASWTDVPLSDVDGVLALSSNGDCIPARPWSEEDIQLFVDRNTVPVPIQWPAGIEQTLWNRHIEAAEPFQEAAAFDPAGGGELWLGCGLAANSRNGIDPATSVYYGISSDGTARYLGLGPCLDRIIRISSSRGWGARLGDDGRAALYRIRMGDAVRGLSVRNVSTDNTPGVLLTWLETGAEWTLAVIERSTADSAWQTIATVAPPLHAFIDRDMQDGGSCRYRVRWTMASGGTETAYSDAVQVTRGAVIDMLEYLLPPQPSELRYRHRYHTIDENYSSSVSVVYRSASAFDVSPVERRWPFVKITTEQPGRSDTSRASIVAVMGNPPAVYLLDSTRSGWWQMAKYDSAAAANSSETQTVEGYGLWHWQRFLPANAVTFENNGDLVLTRRADDPAMNGSLHHARLRRGTGLVSMSGVGIVVHRHGVDTLSLEFLTDMDDIPHLSDAAIEAAWPNPFASSTHIVVRMERPGSLRLAVYDMLGHEVSLLADGRHAVGRHVFLFNAAGLRPGMYLVRAAAGSAVSWRRLLLLR